MDAEIKSGFCVHCGTGIINDKNSRSSVIIDRSEDVIHYLKVAKENLAMHEWEAASKLVETAIIIDSDCRDAWFMKALLSMRNEAKYPHLLSKAKDPKLKSYGVFSEEDIMNCWGKYTVTVYTKKTYGHQIEVMLDEKEPVLISGYSDEIFGVGPGSHKFTMCATVNREGGTTYFRGRHDFIASGNHEFEIECKAFSSKIGMYKIS